MFSVSCYFVVTMFLQHVLLGLTFGPHTGEADTNISIADIWS